MFAKNCMKMKKSRGGGGGPSLAAPPWIRHCKDDRLQNWLVLTLAWAWFFFITQLPVMIRVFYRMVHTPQLFHHMLRTLLWRTSVIQATHSRETTASPVSLMDNGRVHHQYVLVLVRTWSPFIIARQQSLWEGNFSVMSVILLGRLVKVPCDHYP